MNTDMEGLQHGGNNKPNGDRLCGGRKCMFFCLTGLRTTIQPIQTLVFPKTLGAFLPLLEGERRGEEVVQLTFLLAYVLVLYGDRVIPAAAITKDD
jgi:hypothetical protein